MAIETEHERWTASEGHDGYIRARLRLLPTEDGGRKTPIVSGYRSHWGFPPDVHPDAHDAPLTIESGPGQGLDPGDETQVRLHPLAPALWPSIAPGLRLILLEGSRVIGHAEIIEAIPAVS
jgi:hypothetical protein